MGDGDDGDREVARDIEHRVAERAYATDSHSSIESLDRARLDPAADLPIIRFEAVLQRLERLLHERFDRHAQSLPCAGARCGARCSRKKSTWTCSRARLSLGSGTMCVADSVMTSARLPAT
jgi:hypothetical protein